MYIWNAQTVALKKKQNYWGGLGPLKRFPFTIFYEKAATFKANQISFIGMGHTKGLPLTDPENNTDL